MRSGTASAPPPCSSAWARRRPWLTRWCSWPRMTRLRSRATRWSSMAGWCCADADRLSLGAPGGRYAGGGGRRARPHHRGPGVMSEVRRRNERRFAATARDFAGSQVVRDVAQFESLFGLIAPSADDALLDVACGPGRLLTTFAPHVRIAVGADLTMEMLRIARDRLPAGATAGLVRGEGEHLPFRDQAFTVVTTTLAIHHYEDPRRVLEEMVRLCRHGGKIAVGDIVGANDDVRRARQNEIERLRDPSHVEMLSAPGLEAMLTSVGLVPLGRAQGIA